MASTLGVLIEIEPSAAQKQDYHVPEPPQRAFPRTYHSVPAPIELDTLQQDAVHNGFPVSGFTTPSGAQTPRTLSGSQTPWNSSDLEASRPTSPLNETEGVDVMQSFSNPPMNRYRMAAICMLNFGNGLGDSAPGALIPYMEKHYDVGYAVVSLIFIANAIGFILAAFLIDGIRGRYGRGKTLMLAQSLMSLGFLLVVCTPPFPVIVVAFLVIGVGMSMNLALSNVFAANLHNSTKMLGGLHGSYGIGGTIGPLMATAMVSKGHLLWSRYYFICLSMAAFNIAFSSWSFWNWEQESGQPLRTALERLAARQRDAISGNKTNHLREQLSGMSKALKSRVVLLGALFIFAYQGAEVSISGWVISFLITTRHGNPASVGYVTSGFWAGITIGRFVLSQPAHKIGEKIFVYGVVGGAIIFQLLTWLIPNVIGEAVAVSIVGLLLGPVYPCATVIFARAIGRKEQVSSLSVISAFGSSGGAFAPFTTGILAQAVGTFVLHPIAIGLFVVMIACWIGLPTPRKRKD